MAKKAVRGEMDRTHDGVTALKITDGFPEGIVGEFEGEPGVPALDSAGKHLAHQAQKADCLRIPAALGADKVDTDEPIREPFIRNRHSEERLNVLFLKVFFRLHSLRREVCN